MNGPVLLTGASGFVGRQVLGPLRAAGVDLHSCGPVAPTDGTVTHYDLDLFDTEAGDALLADLRPTRILHLAWYVAHRLFWEAPENAAWRDLTFAFARSAAAHGVRRFVGIGTCAEYDLTVRPGAPRREDDPLAGTTYYGRIKIETFRGLEAIFAGAGVSFAWARLFHLWGPGEAPGRLVSELLACLARDEPFRLGAPHAVRDVASTVEIGRALAALLLGDLQGPVNIAGGVPRTLLEVCLEFAGPLGKTHLVDASSDGGRGDVLVADVTRARAAGIV